MQYSEKLNGFWEEGYHYYLEFRGAMLTVRSYDRSIVLETEVSYDADALERGERTLIYLKDPVLSRSLTGEMMTEIGELAWENGELKFLYHYPLLGDKVYTLHKVDHGPFAHIILRDDEYLDRLQGSWTDWSFRDKKDYPSRELVIKGSRLSWGVWGGGAFHVISYAYSPERVLITPEDLTKSNFGSFTQIEVKPDMLLTHMIIYDMDTPTTVFAREDMLDKIEVPDSAKRAPRSTMMAPEPDGPMNMGMGSIFGMGMMPQPSVRPAGTAVPNPAPAPDPAAKQGPTILDDGSTFCPDCGTKLEPPIPKFCPNCGAAIRK